MRSGVKTNKHKVICLNECFEKALEHSYIMRNSTDYYSQLKI